MSESEQWNSIYPELLLSNLEEESEKKEKTSIKTSINEKKMIMTLWVPHSPGHVLLVNIN